MSFLPGMFPAGAAAGGLTTLTQIDSATSTADTITGPATIRAGDLLVLWDVAVGTGLPTVVVPSDFSLIVDANNAGDHRCLLSAKIATGAEASASLTGMDGTSVNRKGIYVFRGNRALSTFAANDVGNQVTDGDPTSQTVNAAGQQTPLIIIGAYGHFDNVTIDPRTFSPAKDGEITAGTRHYLAYRIYNTAPADTSVDMDDEGFGNSLVSCYITTG